jgi:hypothetical protein
MQAVELVGQVDLLYPEADDPQGPDDEGSRDEERADQRASHPRVLLMMQSL